ncbi:hypothetical protein C4J81_13795 [Deltaproteobacteria bacterium Smac51]|nr:hypothetical protein C4J81_13795 [Deltaproteobacteria bacterium Smac51]
MMKNPIYEPRARALEYCDLAVNIYTGCPHRCEYCYVPSVFRRKPEVFHSNVEPRPGIVESVKRQLAASDWRGRKIMLCFMCDPYPIGFDTSATRGVIMAIKESGNHVQILTKGDETAQRDFDLLDENDWFGVTWSGAGPEDEPGAAHPKQRYLNIGVAKHKFGINTWMSCEPVIDPTAIIEAIPHFDSVDVWKIGKLNHRKSDIDWAAFGHQAEEMCQKCGRSYYIKEDLRKAMEG